MNFRKALPFGLFIVPWIVFAILNLFFFQLSSVDFGGMVFWYYYIFLLSINLLPLTNRLFPQKHQGMIFFSKMISLFLIFYLDWLLAYLPFFQSRETRLTLVLITLITMAHWGAKGSQSLSEILIKNWKKVLLSEGLFLFVFATFLVLRAYSPEIYWGEKPMDFTFLNFMSRNSTFPAQDPWFSGFQMKYYYWGYFFYSGLIKVSGVKEELGYALAVASCAAFFAQAISGLLFQMTKRISLAFFGSLILCLGSHWNTIQRFTQGGKIDISFFWKSTRLFERGEFAEFPFWSFLFADLHPHVMSYSWSILFIALFISFWSDTKKWKWPSLLLLSLSWGSLLAINSWDFIVMSLFAAFFSLFYLFFTENFKVQLHKIGQLCLSALIVPILFLPMVLSLKGGTPLDIRWNFGGRNDLIHYFGFQGHWWVLILISAFPILRQLKVKKLLLREGFTKLMLAMLVTTVLLNLFSENIIIHDRFNSVFKFGNITFILWGLLAVLSLRPSWFYVPWKFRLQTHMLAILVLAPTLLASYINASAFLTYNPFGTERPSLYGSRYLKKMNPGDYDVIRWIRGNVEGTPTLLEGYGPSFDHRASRVSMHTGIPTFLGWTGHVKLRGVKGLSIEKRKKEVDFIYNSLDAIKAYEMLVQNKISFIVIGPYEESQYSFEGLAKFSKFQELFKPLISSKQSTLYAVGDISEFVR